MTETREIGVGLISVGWMGKLHTRAYQAMPSVYPELGLKCRLVIAADTAPDRVEYAKDVLGYERGTTDYREVLADPDVDVVSICAPNMLHREIGIAAAKAGKPFWIEKPVGRDAHETAEVAAAAREAGVATSIGYNYRHAPAIEHMRELIADGTLGRITNIRSVFLNGYASEPKGALSWRFQKEFSGSGAMGDLLSHVADLVQYVVGPIDEVTALSTIIHAERPILPMGSGTHFAVIEDGEMGTVENEDYGAVLARFAPNSARRRRRRHPGVLPGRRRAAVRARHRGLRHRGLGHLELRADERAQARRRPRRRARRLHHHPRQPGHGRLRQVPARSRQQHGLRRPQGHRGQEVPAVGHPGRARCLHHRRRTVRSRGRQRGGHLRGDRVVGEGAGGPGATYGGEPVTSSQAVGDGHRGPAERRRWSWGWAWSTRPWSPAYSVPRSTSSPTPTDADLAVAQGAIVRADAVVDAAFLDRTPRMRVLARTGVGTDLVDLDDGHRPRHRRGRDTRQRHPRGRGGSARARDGPRETAGAATPR